MFAGGCSVTSGGSGIFGFVRIAGTGTESVVSSVSMMIKCSLAAIRWFRGGGFAVRGGIGGDTSGGASKLHILFVPDESFVASR